MCVCMFFNLDHSAAFLIISNRHSILVADLKEQGLERVPIIVENVVATASNMHTGTIFWSDMKLKKISRLDKSSEPRDVCGLILINKHRIPHMILMALRSFVLDYNVRIGFSGRFGLRLDWWTYLLVGFSTEHR